MEMGIRARGLVWIAIVSLACGLCYSIGFQSGWTQGTATLDDRLKLIDDALHDLMAQTPPDEGAPHAATDADAYPTG
jgi:hypothetical protein